MSFLDFDILSLFTLTNILVIVIGTIVGLIVGALPGLGGLVGIVLLLPFTYTLPPVAAILLLLATYQAAEYGGSISSITLGIPGTPSAVATLLDGHTYAKKNSPGKALAFSLYASSIGGLFGGLVLLFLSLPLSKLALSFSDTEYFLLALIGLLAVGGLSSKDKTKSMISVVLGLATSTIGIDMFTAQPRFTFGKAELMDGVSIVALTVGMFALTEVFSMISDKNKEQEKFKKGSFKTDLKVKEFKKVTKPITLGSIIGSIVGIFPGLGAGVSSWLAYSGAKRISKKPETFGEGNPEGIVGPESANNATVGGALVPLLTLGIPGSPTIAIVMGGFILQGIYPGPNLFEQESDLVYGILYGFLFTTIAMFLIGKFFTSLFARVLIVPKSILIPIILTFSFIGVYVSKNNYFDLWFALIIGMVFYILVKLDFSLPSFVLAFVLGPIIEESLRRSLLVSDGSYLIFLTRPYSLTIILATISIFILFLFFKKKKIKNI